MGATPLYGVDRGIVDATRNRELTRISTNVVGRLIRLRPQSSPFGLLVDVAGVPAASTLRDAKEFHQEECMASDTDALQFPCDSLECFRGLEQKWRLGARLILLDGCDGVAFAMLV